MKRFASGDTSVLKQHYEKKVHELEHEKNTLQREIEQLRHNLANISSNSDDGAQKLKEEYLQKLNALETQVAELKKKQDARAQLLRQKLKSDEAAKRLQDEMQRIKTQKLQLQRKIKQESEQFRQWKASIEKEVFQLKKEGRRNKYEMHKLKELNQRQKLVLRRKTEEAAMAKKRLKELLDSRKAPCETSGSNRGPGIPELMQTIEHELEVTIGVHEVRSEYERQMKELKEEKDSEIRDLKEKVRHLELQKAEPNRGENLMGSPNSSGMYDQELLEDMDTPDNKNSNLENDEDDERSPTREPRKQNLEGVCCTCSKKSECKTSRCKCRYESGLCSSSCSCLPINCSNREATKDTLHARGSRNSTVLTSGMYDQKLPEDMVTSDDEHSDLENDEDDEWSRTIGRKREDVCCSCTRNSECKTTRCECRTANSTCSSSCSCWSTREGKRRQPRKQNLKTDSHVEKVIDLGGQSDLRSLEGVCCTCSKSSSCKTSRCECRAASGNCSSSCSCGHTRCSNKGATKDTLQLSGNSSVSEEAGTSHDLAAHGAMLLQTALSDKNANQNTDGTVRKPLSDIGNKLGLSNVPKPNNMRKKFRKSAVQLVPATPPASQPRETEVPEQSKANGEVDICRDNSGGGVVPMHKMKDEVIADVEGLKIDDVELLNDEVAKG